MASSSELKKKKSKKNLRDLRVSTGDLNFSIHSTESLDLDDDILEDGESPTLPMSEMAKHLMAIPPSSPGLFKRKSLGSRKDRKAKMNASKGVKSMSAINTPLLSLDSSDDESITEEPKSPSLSDVSSPSGTPGSKSKRRKSKKKLARLSSLEESRDSLPPFEDEESSRRSRRTTERMLSGTMGSGMKSSVRKGRSALMLESQSGSSRRSKRSIDDGSKRSRRSTRTLGADDGSKRSSRKLGGKQDSSRRSRRTLDTTVDADDSSRGSKRSLGKKKKSKKAVKKDKRKSAESYTSNSTSVTLGLDESWASLKEDPPDLPLAPVLQEECENAGVTSMFHNSVNFSSNVSRSSDSSLDLSLDTDDDDNALLQVEQEQVDEQKKELPKFLSHASLDEENFHYNKDAKGQEDDDEKKEELACIKEEVVPAPPSRRSTTRTSSRRGNSCGPIKRRGRNRDRDRDEDRPSSKRGFSVSPERAVNSETMEAERPLLSCMKGSRGRLFNVKLKNPKVYFNECLVITPIIPTYELASKRSDLWFRQKDFDKILNRSMAIALRVKEGRKTRKCVRGLEHFLKDKEERFAAWNAVLVEQEIQNLSGDRSDVRMRDLYLAASTTCRTEAQERAEEDFVAILGYMKGVQ